MRLPQEIASLVQHIELNKAGWWERAVDELVLGIIWLNSSAMTIAAISQALEGQFGFTPNVSRLTDRVINLASDGRLIRSTIGDYKLSDTERAAIEMRLTDAEYSERAAKEEFLSLLSNVKLSVPGDTLWERFNADFLLPVVREFGASIYTLLLQTEAGLSNTPNFDQFLLQFPLEEHQPLRDALDSFLSASNPAGKTYALRCLHAYFLAESCALSGNTIQRLQAWVSAPVTFRLFVDTNVLFSVLDLHDHPANDAVRSLIALFSELPSQVKITLYALPITLEEAQRVIHAVVASFGRVPLAPNLARAALSDDAISGIAKRFIEAAAQTTSPINVEDYLEPYIRNLVTVSRAKGVELFNKSTAGYGTRQDVVDDLTRELEREKYRAGRQKTYEQWEHDIILWHVVSEQRPAHVESPVDAIDWVVTLDNRLIRFDSAKTQERGGEIPLTIAPATLTQILQFWIPRSTKFEETLLSNMRLPLLFLDFDTLAADTTLRILTTLARFENVSDLPQDTIVQILRSQKLRQEIRSHTRDAEGDLELVHGGILSELEETKALLGNHGNRIDQLEQALRDSEAKSVEAVASAASQYHDIEARLAESERLRGEAERVREERGQVLTFLKQAFLTVLTTMAVTFVVQMTANSLALHEKLRILTTLVIWILAVVGSLFMVDHLAQDQPTLSEKLPFVWLHRLQHWFWGVVLSALVIRFLWELISHVGDGLASG